MNIAQTSESITDFMGKSSDHIFYISEETSNFPVYWNHGAIYFTRSDCLNDLYSFLNHFSCTNSIVYWDLFNSSGKAQGKDGRTESQNSTSPRGAGGK